MPSVLYCIETANGRRTYVGIAKNFKQRLRRHNREISGGARATGAGRGWRPMFIVSNFPDQRTVRQYEWRMHRRTRPSPSNPFGPGRPACRPWALKRALEMAKVTSTATDNAALNLTIQWRPDSPMFDTAARLLGATPLAC